MLLGIATMCTVLCPISFVVPVKEVSAAEIAVRNSNSIQTAIDALGKEGGRITLPVGTFEIDRTLLLGSNITLEGAGANTIIKVSDKFDVATDVIANRDREGNGQISIRSLQVIGDWAKSESLPLGFTGASAIRMSNVTGLTIRDVVVKDCPGSGIRLAENCQQVLIDNITSENNAQGVGIHGRSQDVTINNSLIRKNSNGIFLWSEGGVISNLRITNNRILDHVFDDGIKIFGAVHYQIIGNLIDGARENAIEVHNIPGPGVTSGHFIISGNIIRNVDDGYNGGSNGIGINFVGPNTPQDNHHPIVDFVISNNIIENTMFGFASEMRQAGRGVFTGNYVSNAAKGGMHILRTENISVTGNVFADIGNYKSVEGFETFGIQATDVKDSTISNNIIMDTRKDAKFKQDYGLLFRHKNRNVAVANNVIVDVQKPIGFLYGSDAFLNKNMVVTDGVATYLERGRAVNLDEVLRTSREGGLGDLQNLSSRLREDHAGARELRVVDFYEALALNSSGKTDESGKRFPGVSWGNFAWEGSKAALAPRQERQEIKARRLNGIKLDGRFDEADWAKANWQGNFTDFRRNTAVAEKTAVAVGYDDENLYLAWSCYVSPKTLTVKEMDNVANVWGDDNIEFFIAPPGSGIDYYQFIVNPLGGFYDALRDKGSWQSEAKMAVAVGTDCWNVEMAIPIKSMTTARSRDGWKINFNRKDKSYLEEAEQVLSTWAFTNGANNDVSHFGKLAFE